MTVKPVLAILIM